MRDICYFWLTMGPYHYSRMNALVDQGYRVRVIELTSKDDHFWELDEEARFERITIHDELLNDDLLTKSIDEIESAISENPPEIFVNGAGFFNLKFNFLLNQLAKKHTFRLLLWSESTHYDNKSNFLKKLAKRYALKPYDGALVAGKRHKAYLNDHGLSEELIFEVGNVVDNKAFELTDEDYYQIRRDFLFVGRLLDIKSVDLLLNAFAQYRNLCEDEQLLPWGLTICGDGPERNKLEKLTEQLNIDGLVNFTGNLQFGEVRRQYQKHGVFILPSESEPWGLVVNEAMASSMPVIVSERCGCVPELVNEHENGFRFIPDSSNPEVLALLMLEIHKDPDLRAYMSRASLKIIQNYSPEAYAKNCSNAFDQILKR